MKHFIWKLLMFFIIPFLFLFSLDSFLRNQNSLHKEKYKTALKQKDSIEIIILGNSHATYGVNPTGFKKYAYNLANVNQSIYFDKRITLSLLPKLKRIKYVLISIDYHSLYFSSQGEWDKWSYMGNGIKYKNNRTTLIDISPSLFCYSLNVSVNLLKKRLFDEHKGGSIDFDVEKGVKLNHSIVKGYISFAKSDDYVFNSDTYKSRAELFNRIITKSTENKEIIQDLCSFLEILKKQGIVPIMFTCPTYSEYNRYLIPYILEKNTIQMKAICTKYHINYWNFMNSEKFKKKDFYNQDHLTENGALKFSKIINDSILNLERLENK